MYRLSRLWSAVAKRRHFAGCFIVTTTTAAHDGLTSNWRLLGFGFLLMFWSSPGQTYLISLYGAELRQAFALSHADFGGLYSLGTLLSAAVMIWSGRLVDHLDLRYLALGLTLLLALACWVMSLTAGAFSLALAFFLLRHVGQGLMSHAAATAMSRYFERARGRATAIAALGFGLAEAILPALTVALIAWAGWRGAWQLTGFGVLVVLTPAVVWLLRDHGDRHRRYLARLRLPLQAAATAPPLRHQWTRAEVLRDRRFYLAMPAFLSPAFFFTGFFFHQVHLVTVKGWDLGWWGALFTVYAVSSLLTTALTGPLVDRYGAIRLMPLFALPIGLALLVLSLTAAPFGAVLFLMLSGTTAGWAMTVMGPFWAECYGVAHLGSIKALGSALGVFASALSPFLLGWLIDLGIALNTLALLSAGYILLACLLAAVSARRYAPKPLSTPLL